MLEPWLISCWAHASSNLACSISSFCLIHLLCPSTWPSATTGRSRRRVTSNWVHEWKIGLLAVLETGGKEPAKCQYCSTRLSYKNMFLPSLYCQKTTTAMDPVLYCLLNVKMGIHLKKQPTLTTSWRAFTSRTGQVGLCWGYIDLFITCSESQSIHLAPNVVMLTCF